MTDEMRAAIEECFNVESSDYITNDSWTRNESGSDRDERHYGIGFYKAVELLTPLIDAVEFYGSENNWIRFSERNPDGFFCEDASAIDMVNGKTARDAINNVLGGVE